MCSGKKNKKVQLEYQNIYSFASYMKSNTINQHVFQIDPQTSFIIPS